MACNLLEKKDWKSVWAAVQLFSQMAEYLIEDADKFEQINTVIRTQSRNSHSKVRHACCHALGLFPETKNTFVVEKY